MSRQSARKTNAPDFRRTVLGGLAALSVIGTAVPAAAQDNAETRIRKLEAEIRALQRKVFPGADGRYFEPEITGTPAQPTGVAAPSTTAVTDILARLDAMEGSLQRLTAMNEENGNELRELGTRLAALEVTSRANVQAATAGPTPAGTPAADANLAAMSGGASASAATIGSATPAARPPVPSPAPVAAPSAERLAAVQAIAKPQTDDPGDDEYSYGYRLWDAGFFPEAQQQLNLFVEKYPNHSRVTYGRNLLGRAYLDDGKPREAAPWFLRNYQADKQAARAPDSLLYLARAMIAIEDTERACIALAEFSDTYPAIAAGRLSGDYQNSLARVNCD
nr:tetratricopeptide repeat protein [Pseudopontixanthobacter vadosimaris]